MGEEKRRQILTSRYYDARKKKWNYEAFVRPCIPTVKTVNEEIEEWDKLVGYPEQERALRKLFVELCPRNDSLEDILIKVSALNDFYSTNIYKVLDVAKVILELQIDSRLQKDVLDAKIVDDIDARVKQVTGRSVYSFASKYCSHHRPDLYPIYDSYVDLLLRYYRDEANDALFTFNDKDLKNYSGFCQAVEMFKKHYEITQFDAKSTDKFLWLVGKKTFPKWKNE